MKGIVRFLYDIRKVIAIFSAVILYVGVIFINSTYSLFVFGENVKAKVVNVQYVEEQEFNPEDGHQVYNGYDVEYSFLVNGKKYSETSFFSKPSINMGAFGIDIDNVEIINRFKSAEIDVVYSKLNPSVHKIIRGNELKESYTEVVIHIVFSIIGCVFVYGIVLTLIEALNDRFYW